MTIFKASLPDESGYTIEVDSDTNRVTWNIASDSWHKLPSCFGRVVGITTRPRLDAFMLIFLERAVYAMDCDGPYAFSFRPVIVD